MYRPSGCNRIFCVAVSTERRCFEMPSLPVERECSVLRMRAIPDGALGKIIAARKHRALAGCKREGAVCICKTINFSTRSFITNEQYEPRNAELYYFVYICVSIYLSTQILNEYFVFMLFCNNDYSRELAGHMRPITSVVRPASAQCCWCVIFSPMDWWSRSGTVHRKYTGLPRRIDRNEYYFALLYIVRQVIIPYSALQFRRNSPVLCSFEIPRMPGHKVACRACVQIPMYSGL